MNLYSVRVLIVFSVMLVSCSRKDAIETLAQRLSADPYWYNGYQYPIKLPSNAAPNDLIREVFRHGHLLNGSVTRILISREVSIKGKSYSAFLIETDAGERIVIARYLPDFHEWEGYEFTGDGS